jgi:chromosome segregation ATPase
MPQLIAMVLKWLLGKLGLLLVILAILLVGARLKTEWDQHRATQGALEQQEAVLDGLRADLQSIEVAMAADQSEWRRRTAERMRALWDELDALNDRILASERQSQAARGKYLDLARQAQSARRAANQAKVKLDTLERGYWWWDSYVSPTKVVELQAARATYAALDRTADAAEAARSRASRAAAQIRREIGQLQARQKVLLQTIEDPDQAESPRHDALAAAARRKQQEIDSFDAVLDAERARVERNPRERLIATVKSRIPMALGILAGILLLPVAIKALFYFVLAPLATRLGPIRILPSDDPPPLTR